MSHPIVHAEIRSSDPDATRPSSASCSAGATPPRAPSPATPSSTPACPDALYTAISPLQGDRDLVTFFVGVDDMAGAIERRPQLGGRVVQEPVTVPGVSFALIADPQGHVVGLANSSDPRGPSAGPRRGRRSGRPAGTKHASRHITLGPRTSSAERLARSFSATAVITASIAPPT